MIARFGAFALATIAAVASAQEAAWVVRPPEAPLVPFRGLANFDAAGGSTAQILYPAPGLAGFIAAVATHGILVDATKRRERSAIQEKADEVLSPLKPVLAEFGTRTMLHQALPRMTSPGRKRVLAAEENPAGDWVIESTPEFAITQDKRAIILDNGISLYRAGEQAPAYRNVVRVVSAPLAAEADGHWAGEDGKNLKETSAMLWAQSVDIAIAELHSPTRQGQTRTIRFPEGGNERIERAEVLQETCARLLIRTLRGEVMSVPVRQVPIDCTAAR